MEYDERYIWDQTLLVILAGLTVHPVGAWLVMVTALQGLEPLATECHCFGTERQPVSWSERRSLLAALPWFHVSFVVLVNIQSIAQCRGDDSR